MNVVKCKNGHFFDGDTYTMCPHCGEGVAFGAPAAAKEPEKKKFGWGRKEKTGEPQAPEFPYVAPAAAPAPDPKGKNPTDVLPREEYRPVPSTPAPAKNEHTLDFWQTASHSDPAPIVNEPEVVPVSVAPAAAPAAETDEPKPADPPVSAPPPVHREALSQAGNAGTSSLRDAVQKASANSEGKTMSYFSAATSGSENNTKQDVPTDPVVGWLVCISGKHFGESFSIGAGKNSIGRNDDNRIVLYKDNKVSRTKHALITFEPKKRFFYLQPGDSSGLTYLNDDYIDESKKLKPKDIIELGDSKFLFVPLCDETFSWEEYLPKE